MTLDNSESDLVWFVGLIKWRDSPGSSGVILVASDTPQPLLHRILVDFFWVHPSGIFNARIHPHRMVAGLKWLNASSEEDFQQIHSSYTLTDEIDHSLNQHFHLRFLPWSHFQGGGLLYASHRKRRKSSRLTWSRLVFAVKPGRLPPSD